MRCTTLLLFIVFTFCSGSVFAQAGVVSGKVVASGSGLSAATVSLLSGSDSSWIKSIITDDSGTFTFDKLAKGGYIVTVTFIGYKTASEAVSTGDNEKKEISFSMEKENTLGEVTVAARKPFIEMSLGKT